jgi:hypothetical protein
MAVAVGPPGVMLGVGELPGPAGVGVHVGEEGADVGVIEGVSVGPETVGVLDAGVSVDGVCVAVGTGDSTGVVGEVPGVGVELLPRTVRLPGIKLMAVRRLSP